VVLVQDRFSASQKTDTAHLGGSRDGGELMKNISPGGYFRSLCFDRNCLTPIGINTLLIEDTNPDIKSRLRLQLNLDHSTFLTDGGGICDSVISLRREAHMTQKELASKCGVTQASISNLEKGITKPTIDTLKKIADAFSLRLRIQFTGREEE
jgi:DNA-binding XRE family transcriptional regulator